MPEAPQIKDLVPDSSVVLFPLDRIFLNPNIPRQRSKAEPDAVLMDSMAQRGLINPIFIHASGELIAGERRFRAAQQLKWPTIRATIKENLDPLIAYQIELLENIARKQLNWQEEVVAVANYHNAKVQQSNGVWTQLGTANDVGMSPNNLGRYLLVAGEMGDEDVASCQTFTAAFNFIQNRAERARAAAQSRNLEFGEVAAAALNLPPIIPENATKEEKTAIILGNIDLQKQGTQVINEIDQAVALINSGKLAKAALEQHERKEQVSDIIINADALEWAESYSGPKFDVLHLDFPWGKGYKGSNTRKSPHVNPVYNDDPDIYFGLVDGLLTLQDNFTFPTAHALCWIDMSYYSWTIERFEQAGWKLVTPFPYIWTKSYQGVASDTKRRPRHCYEVCLMFSRGDRKIINLDKDHFEEQVDEKLHMNQKPQGMLRHLLNMFVDEHTAVLDPTCGSGSSLVAARALKSPRYLGIELDHSNSEIAKFLLARHAPKKEEADEA